MKNALDFGELKNEKLERVLPPETSAPSRPVVSHSEEQKPEPAPRVFESRDLQISIKGEAEVIQRFKDLCEEERYPYWKMLGILMDSYQK